MKEEILKKLCNKYCGNKKLIEIMIQYALKEDYKIEEIVKIIEEFYKEKSMQ